MEIMPDKSTQRTAKQARTYRLSEYTLGLLQIAARRMDGNATRALEHAIVSSYGHLDPVAKPPTKAPSCH